MQCEQSNNNNNMANKTCGIILIWIRKTFIIIKSHPSKWQYYTNISISFPWLKVQSVMSHFTRPCVILKFSLGNLA